MCATSLPSPTRDSPRKKSAAMSTDPFCGKNSLLNVFRGKAGLRGASVSQQMRWEGRGNRLQYRTNIGLTSWPKNSLNRSKKPSSAPNTAPALGAIVALLVALAATFVALISVKDRNITLRMNQAQAKAIDTWNYYQAKSMKQNLAEATLDQLTARSAAAGGAAGRRQTDRELREAGRALRPRKGRGQGRSRRLREEDTRSSTRSTTSSTCARRRCRSRSRSSASRR